MTREELIAAATALNGGREYGALRALSERVGVSYDTLRQIASGKRTVPSGLAAEIEDLVLRQPREVTLHVLPGHLPPDADRDNACADALDGPLDTLAAAAEAAGWHPAEVAVATLCWAADRARDMSTPAAVIETLEGLIAQLRPPA